MLCPPSKSSCPYFYGSHRAIPLQQSCKLLARTTLLRRRELMGQSLMKFAPDNDPVGILSKLWKEIEDTAANDRTEQHKEKEIGATIEECYGNYFANMKDDSSFDDFYEAICKTVEEINTKLNSTQFRVPDKEKLQEVYDSHYLGKEKTLKKEDFQKILQEVIIRTGVTGFGSKDVLLFIFGIPAAALFIKQRVAPKTIPNDIFIPGATSATVYLLAKLNKI